MELEDSLYPLLREVSIGIDPYVIFEDADWALLIGAKPRGPGVERAALLDINGQIFAEQVSFCIIPLISSEVYRHKTARSPFYKRDIFCFVRKEAFLKL
jgi:hypothetical protein